MNRGLTARWTKPLQSCMQAAKIRLVVAAQMHCTAGTLSFDGGCAPDILGKFANALRCQSDDFRLNPTRSRAL